MSSHRLAHPMRVPKVPVSRRASNIEYAIRDVVLPATELEAQGHQILKLNIGDPLAYPGLSTPSHMVEAFQSALGEQRNGYSPSYGLPDLRVAIAADESTKSNGGWPCTADDVYICHGVTEALQVIFAAFLEPGDVVLSPGPHYPPYMAYPPLFGGRTVEYRLDPLNGWSIDFDDLESKLDDSVKLLVLINPNNPTGGTLTSAEIDRVVELAERFPHCTLISDEIYDRLNFRGDHISTASRAGTQPVITLNGVSKVYYAPGWRIGYMALHDPHDRLSAVRDGMERLLRSRLCASTPAQSGYLAGLKGDDAWMATHLQRIELRRDVCLRRIESIPGLEVQAPQGAFYMFVRLTDDRWKDDDKGFVLELLHQEHVLFVHGSGFSPEYGRGHFRLVYLPDEEMLNTVFDRVHRFLNG